MSVENPFIVAGLHEVRRAVTDVVAMTDLQLGVRKITRSLAQRASGRLRMIETIVRRLIFLLALSLKVEGHRPRPTRAPKPEAPLPEGVELAHFPRVPVRRLKLLPRKQPLGASGPFPDTLRASGRAIKNRGGPIYSGRLRDRVVALQRALADPEGHARRLARHLHRLRTVGEPRPCVASMASAYRLRPELGALAVILPERLNAALKMWDNSG